MKRTNLTSGIRQSCWINYFGSQFEGKCAVGCEKKINVFDYECGHIEAVSSGGSNQITNIRPICGGCNKSMGTTNMIEYIKRSGYCPSWILQMEIHQPIIAVNHSLYTVPMTASQPLSSYRIINGSSYSYVYDMPVFADIPWKDITAKEIEVVEEGIIKRYPIDTSIYRHIKCVKPSWDVIIPRHLSLESIIITMSNAFIDYRLTHSSYTCDDIGCSQFIKFIEALSQMVIMIKGGKVSDVIGDAYHSVSHCIDIADFLDSFLQPNSGTTLAKIYAFMKKDTLVDYMVLHNINTCRHR